MCIGYIPSTSYVNPHIANQYLGKRFHLGSPQLCLYQLTKRIAANIEPRVSSALRDVDVIFDKSILYRSPVMEYANFSGN